jgi:hypothetical protein
VSLAVEGTVELCVGGARTLTPAQRCLCPVLTARGALVDRGVSLWTPEAYRVRDAVPLGRGEHLLTRVRLVGGAR